MKRIEVREARLRGCTVRDAYDARCSSARVQRRRPVGHSKRQNECAISKRDKGGPAPSRHLPPSLQARYCMTWARLASYRYCGSLRLLYCCMTLVSRTRGPYSAAGGAMRTGERLLSTHAQSLRRLRLYASYELRPSHQLSNAPLRLRSSAA